MKPNPFPVTTYLGPDYFCNRKNEIDSLISNIKNGLSTTIVALRRMGKTGLIRHVFGLLPKSYVPVYVDILATRDQNDFLNAIITAVANSVPQQSGTGKKIWQFIRSLRPIVTYNPVSGIPQVSIESSPDIAESNIQSVLVFLENLDKKVVIAIDEFQQILEYPNDNVDAGLRSVIQSLNNVVFVFSGSQRHLMTDLFANPKRPFYRSTQLMSFDTISQKEYLSFIRKHFEQNGKNIEDQTLQQISTWTRLHTYYTQLLCNRLFSTTKSFATPDVFRNESNRLLKEQEIIFFQYRDLLTSPQWNLLSSIGKEDVVSTPTAINFVNKYKLGNPATVLRSLKALEEKDMIYSRVDENGKKSYFVYDLFLNRWFQERYKLY